MTLDQLKAELDGVQEAIRFAKYNQDYVKTAELEEQEARILAQMDEVSKQEAHQQSIVESVTSEESSFVLVADGYQADFRALAAGETQYQILAITTQLYISGIEVKHNSVVQALNEQLAHYKSELSQTQADLSDVRSKLDAAATEITNLTIERDNVIATNTALTAQIDELSKQSPKPVATNLDGSSKLAELNAKWEAERIPVYDVQPGDFRTSFYTAKLAETGESIEIRPHYLLKSKYRGVTAEEAEQFRAQAEAEKAAALDAIPESVTEADSQVSATSEGVKIPEAFQSEDETGVPESRDEALPSVHGEGDTGRVDALEARVTDLEDGFKRLSAVVADMINEKAA